MNKPYVLEIKKFLFQLDEEVQDSSYRVFKYIYNHIHAGPNDLIVQIPSNISWDSMKGFFSFKDIESSLYVAQVCRNIIDQYQPAPKINKYYYPQLTGYGWHGDGEKRVLKPLNYPLPDEIFIQGIQKLPLELILDILKNKESKIIVLIKPGKIIRQTNEGVLELKVPKPIFETLKAIPEGFPLNAVDIGSRREPTKKHKTIHEHIRTLRNHLKDSDSKYFSNLEIVSTVGKEGYMISEEITLVY